MGEDTVAVTRSSSLPLQARIGGRFERVDVELNAETLLFGFFVEQLANHLVADAPERVLFEERDLVVVGAPGLAAHHLRKVGDKQELGRQIMGMNQGDLPSFENLMTRGYEGLKKSTASIKHMIVFSDGDPGGPSDQLMNSMRAARSG